MNDGEVLSVCISEKKGTPKKSVRHAWFVEGHGVDGDAHAGDWHRQVSLLADERIDALRGRGVDLPYGAFAENLVISGVDLDELGIGSMLAVGGALLEITQIGKQCHNACAIRRITGDCVMPRHGLFAKVLAAGDVCAGDVVKLLRVIPRSAVQAAVLTISDRCSQGLAEDTAGPAVAAMIREKILGNVAVEQILPDDEPRISEELRNMASRSIDLILTVGGTGVAVRDRTPEATRAVIDRELPGVAEAMRAASLRVTPHAMLSRGVAGTIGRSIIVNLPGSLKGAVENLEVVLPVLRHAVDQLRGDLAHPLSDAGRTVHIKKSGDA